MDGADSFKGWFQLLSLCWLQMVVGEKTLKPEKRNPIFPQHFMKRLGGFRSGINCVPIGQII